MKKAVLFARVSSAKQDFERQKEDLMPLIKQDGYSEDEVAIINYKESAIKNDIQNRKSITELIKIIDDNPIENVYVTEISRLARRNDVMYSVLSLLEQKEITLVVQQPQLIRTYETVNGRKQKSAIASLIIQFMSYLAETEMATKQERFASGRKQKIAEGHITTSRFKFGYDKVNKCAVINKDKAALIVKMFKDYASGKSTGLIWEDIKHLGYLDANPNKLYSGAKRVYSILSDPTYIGKNRTYKYPQIVDEELFNKVQEMLKQNKLIKVRTSNIYYCQGLIKYKGRILSPNLSDATYQIKLVGESFAININVMDSVAKNLAAMALTMTSRKDKQRQKEEYRQRLMTLNKENEVIDIKIKGKEKEYERNNELYRKGRQSEKDTDYYASKIEEEIEFLNKEKSENNVAILEIENILKEDLNSKGNEVLQSTLNYLLSLPEEEANKVELNKQQTEALNAWYEGKETEDTRYYYNLLSMTTDEEIYNYIHQAIESITIRKAFKCNNVFFFKVTYKDKTIPNNALYKYVRKGWQIKLYAYIDKVCYDWSDTWEKRILRIHER